MPAGITQTTAASVKHVPILQFYDIGSPALPTRTTVADFQSLTDWLAGQGYVPQKLSDYIKWMRGELELPKKSIVLVFYGAFLSQYTQAFPKLQPLGFKFNLMIPGSFIEHEATLQTGAYFTPANLQAMVASGLCEPHSEGYHLKWAFQGTPAAVAELYKAAQINLKWGGEEELVEDAYSYAPLIGTNSALAAISSTYTFSCAARGYRAGSLAPLQVVVKYLVVDHLQVLGTSYSPLVNIYAKRSTDPNYTLLKSGWQPTWASVYEVVTLSTPFTFKAGVQYNLQFVTQSAGGAAGELVTLGSRTGQAGGADTTCASNSSAPGFTSGERIGGDIYLLESLATETVDEVKARVKADAQKNLNFLAPYTPQSESDVGFAYPFNTYNAAGLFLPSTLRALHPLQMTGKAFIGDRFSNLNPATHLGAPEGFPLRQITPVFPVDGTRALAKTENQIDSFSGALWDVAPDWTPWSVAMGWVNEFASDYATELKLHARGWTHLTSTKVSFNPDGLSLDSTEIAGLQTFLQQPEVKGKQILVRITNNADASIAHNIYLNPTQSIQAILDLFNNAAPTLVGMALDIEGAAPADRSIASAWITQLRATRDAQLAGRTILSAVPAKTADLPGDPWSGWCDYAVWGPQSDIMHPLTYGYGDGLASSPPGPSSPWQWMHDVMAYGATTTPKAKLMIGLCFYGTYRTGGPSWSGPLFAVFHDSLRLAQENNAQWFWDATNHEWYWQDDAVTIKGYQPTPQSMKERLEEFAALGYSMFGVWALGQGDGLFYQNAEDLYALAPLIKLPSGVSQRVNDREGSGTVGSYEVEVLQRSSFDLANIMQQQQLHGKKARLRMGYVGINAPQFPAFDTLEVDRVEVSDDQTAWKLNLVDPKRSLKSRIFTTATKEAPVVLAGNPMDLLLVVHQNHLGIGQNPNLGSGAWIQYDLATGANLINPNRYVDVDTILAYRSGFFRNCRLEFSITEPQEGKAWLEREIYKVLGGYPVVDAAGRLSPRFWIAPPLAPAPLAGVFTFTDQNLVGMPVAERAPIVNQITVRMDYDGSKFQTILSFVSGTSFSTFGLQGGHVIESRGLRAARQGIMLAGLLATKLFRRYDSIVPVWRIAAFHAALPVEVGDLVALTHGKVLDPITGQRGVTGILCEVLEKQPDYSRARVSFKLLDVRYLVGTTAYAIAGGVGVPDWPSASQQQKDTYMFIASDSSGLMSDDVAGNTIFG